LALRFFLEEDDDALAPEWEHFQILLAKSVKEMWEQKSRFR
jgi:hypothetical protein